ncbi:hypothetical protein [Helicobacter sp. UBA3407]|uniref:hypothetical protein n=1 Tax=Helicobacter TaxID=209 RepID=UPI002638B69C|nr:hypothetical protein [Helicobacter sp. UBA3407]
MQKYKFGILLAATKDSAFTIGTLLLNILHKMPNQIDVFYIVQDGFCDLDKRIMQEIVESRGGGGENSCLLILLLRILVQRLRNTILTSI